MDGAAVVSLDDVGGNQFAAGNVFRNFTGNEVTLGRNDVAVLIGVFVQDF